MSPCITELTESQTPTQTMPHFIREAPLCEGRPMGLSQRDGKRERQEGRGWQWRRQASGGVGSDESKYSNLIPTINKCVINPLGSCYYKKMAVMLPRNWKAQCPEGLLTVTSTDTGDSLCLRTENRTTSPITCLITDILISILQALNYAECPP